MFMLGSSALATEFDGAWELMSGEYMDHQKKLVQYQALKLKSLKVIADGHFSFISQSNDKFWAAGAGEFLFTETEYIETPFYTSYEMKAGTEYRFNYKLEGEFWYNERWQNGTRVEYEVWRRVE